MRVAGDSDPAPTTRLSQRPTVWRAAESVEKLTIPVSIGDGTCIGETLSDLNLKLSDQLGAGTFGTVHSAWCEQTQTEVAVKVVEFDDADLEDDRLCFVKEVAAMKALGDSRYIVRIQRGALDRDEQSGIIVMERADGPDLDEYLQTQDDPLPTQEALWIGLRVAKALRDMHRAGLVHRDVKCDNVLLYACETGETIEHAKLGDLGLVAAKGESVPSVAGTLDFMPNNLVASWHHEDDPAPKPCFSHDMFSFGCVMLELLGAAPELDEWNKTRQRRIRQNKRVREFQMPERICRKYSQDLIDAVHACLDEDARLRPSADDMVQLLSSMTCDKKRPRLSRAPTPANTAPGLKEAGADSSSTSRMTIQSRAGFSEITAGSTTTSRSTTGSTANLTEAGAGRSVASSKSTASDDSDLEAGATPTTERAPALSTPNNARMGETSAATAETVPTLIQTRTTCTKECTSTSTTITALRARSSSSLKLLELEKRCEKVTDDSDSDYGLNGIGYRVVKRHRQNKAINFDSL